VPEDTDAEFWLSISPPGGVIQVRSRILVLRVVLTFESVGAIGERPASEIRMRRGGVGMSYRDLEIES
jgi:hypothetical protein